MSLLMIHEAYMPVYMGSRFSLRTGGRAGGSTRGSTRGPRGPKKVTIMRYESGRAVLVQYCVNFGLMTSYYFEYFDWAMMICR